MSTVVRHITKILKEMELKQAKTEAAIDSNDQSDIHVALTAGQAAAWQAAISIVKMELEYITNLKKENK